MKKMSILNVLLVGLFGLIGGDSRAADTAVDNLTKLLKPVETFSADFEQTLVSAAGQRLQQVTGTLKAKRPGLFYWETAAPLAQTIVTDGERVWIYDPDLEQVAIQSLSQQLSSTPALLLSGEVATIENEYLIEELDAGSSETRIYRLTPKSRDSLFDTLALAFNGGVLSTMELKDSLGQVTTLFFSNAEVNQSLAGDTFHFQIPDGVDVIRE